MKAWDGNHRNVVVSFTSNVPLENLPQTTIPRRHPTTTMTIILVTMEMMKMTIMLCRETTITATPQQQQQRHVKLRAKRN
jgi:hypothetical protein